MHSTTQFGHKNNEIIQLVVMWIELKVITQAIRLHVDMRGLKALLSQERRVESWFQAAGRAQEWTSLGTNSQTGVRGLGAILCNGGTTGNKEACFTSTEEKILRIFPCQEQREYLREICFLQMKYYALNMNIHKELYILHRQLLCFSISVKSKILAVYFINTNQTTFYKQGSSRT